MTIIAFSGIVHINIHLWAGHCSEKGRKLPQDALALGLIIVTSYGENTRAGNGKPLRYKSPGINQS